MSGTAETSEVWMKGPPRQPPNYFLAIQITEEEASIEYLFRPYPCWVPDSYTITIKITSISDVFHDRWEKKGLNIAVFHQQ